MPVLPSRAFVLLFFVVPGCSMLKAFQWFGVLYHPVIVVCGCWEFLCMCVLCFFSAFWFHLGCCLFPCCGGVLCPCGCEIVLLSLVVIDFEYDMGRKC